MDDVCIIGFGFSGLTTLSNLVRSGRRMRVTVVAPDTRGLGLAYGTTDTQHLLNVRAERMSAWADAPEDFARWLQTAAAAAAAEALGVPVPDACDFAPRALYARYLHQLRERTLRRARAAGSTVTFVPEEATGLRRAADGWTVTAGAVRVRARCCVLAVGHEQRTSLTGAHVHRGPWALRPTTEDGPALIVGTGLTAVDTVLSLRGAGFTGQIVATSRTGLLPRAHTDDHRVHSFTPERLAHVRTVGDVRALFAQAADWRHAMEGLRPHTQQLWRQLTPDAQREAAERWSTVWGVHRHRMAPEIAARIDAELEAGSLRVVPGRVTRGRDVARAHGGRLTAGAPAVARAGRPGVATIIRADGGREDLRPSVTVDCTGATLDWARSDRPLLRGLVADGICTPHHTGLGVTADPAYRVAPDLFAVGTAMTGELWESSAVPELRVQAAGVATAVLAGTTADRPATAPVAA